MLNTSAQLFIFRSSLNSHCCSQYWGLSSQAWVSGSFHLHDGNKTKTQTQ